MAADWIDATLGDLLKFSNGRSSPDRADYHPYAVYGSNGIIGRTNQTNADTSTIIIGRVGSYCGSLYLSKEPCWVTDNAIRATPLDDNDSSFLFYLLSTLSLNSLRAGSGQPLLNQEILNHISALVPDPPTQRAIARILGALDDKIELNRRMNRTLEAMAQALFKSWFVDFDPVRAKMEGRKPYGMDDETAALFPSRLVESELGEIPKGWSVGKLGDIALNLRRSISPQNIDASQIYIGLEHMPKQSLALSDWGSPESLESGKFSFKRGEFLFGKLRPYFHKVGIAPSDGVCSTDILVVVPKEFAWYAFVLEHISSVDFIKFTQASSDGTRMPRTNWRDMAKYEIPLPRVEIAQAYTKLIFPTCERIISNIHELLCSPKFVTFGELALC